MFPRGVWIRGRHSLYHINADVICLWYRIEFLWLLVMLFSVLCLYPHKPNMRQMWICYLYLRIPPKALFSCYQYCIGSGLGLLTCELLCIFLCSLLNGIFLEINNIANCVQCCMLFVALWEFCFVKKIMEQSRWLHRKC